MSSPNKYKSSWFSHSSLSDYKKCPRSYFLRNVYKTKNNKKITTVSPHLSLGVAVHDTIEDLAWIPAKERFDTNLVDKFLNIYSKFQGKAGGFTNQDEYEDFKSRGITMINMVINNPGPILKPAVRMIQDKSELPWMWLSEEEEIIACGKCDWLEYDNGNLHVIDFKTGKSQEKSDSLQFAFYSLLVKKYKKYPLTKASYWYLFQSPNLVSVSLPSYDEAYKSVMDQALIVKEARQSKTFKCKYNGCRHCEPFEKILNGDAEYVGIGGYGSEQYLVK